MPHSIILNSKKVLKHFGQRPWLGKALPCLPKKQVTVGVRWSLPKRDYVPDTEVWVNRTVALHHVQGNTWRVLCDEQYWPRVQTWLYQNCK